MKLYHNGQGWQLPGQQDKAAERVDVPSSPPDLAAWLNARSVRPSSAEIVIHESNPGGDDGERFWEGGPPTKDPPSVRPSDAKLIGQTEFVPIARSAAIAASYGACPKCSRTWTAQVLAGVSSASLEDTKLILEALKRHVGGIREDLEDVAEGEGQGRPN